MAEGSLAGNGRCPPAFVVVLIGAASCLATRIGQAADGPAAAHASFASRVGPLVARYCHDCHAGDAAEGDVSLAAFGTLVDMRKRIKVWQRAAEVIDDGQMPPPDAPQPTEAERESLRQGLRAFLAAEAVAHAGDPGRVVLRRLNNVEYTWTIRDLTGVSSLDPAEEFPADGGAGEGFTNTGQSLVMSPALITKYFDAAKAVAGHAVLLPDGLRFSAADNRAGWIEEAVVRIRDFYQKFDRNEPQPSLLATLAVRERVAGEQAVPAVRDVPVQRMLEQQAATAGLSAKYLARLWEALSARPDGAEESPLLDDLRRRWKNAKPGDAGKLAEAVAPWRKVLWTTNQTGWIGLQVAGEGHNDREGPIPVSFVDPRTPLVDRQEFRVKLVVPAGRDSITLHLAATDAGDGREQDFVVWQNPRLVAAGRADLPLRLIRQAGADDAAANSETIGVDPGLFGRHPLGLAVDANDLCMQAPTSVEVKIPAKLAAGSEFVATAVIHPAAGGAASVQLHAGVVPHDTMPGLGGLFPDAPLLAAKDSAAWRKFESAFAALRRLFPAAFCYQRVRSDDKPVTFNVFYRDDALLEELVLDGPQAAEIDRLWAELMFISRDPLEMVDVHEQLTEFATQDRPQLLKALGEVKPQVAARAAAFERQLVAAEPRHVDAMLDFAARAFRRPLRPHEAEALRGLYGELRRDDLPHEQALALTLARVLVAPAFLYKIEPPGPGTGTHPLGGRELATRLSYFLWSSLPDADLLQAAEAGRLHEPEVLLPQVRRMLADPKSRRLAEEFGTQWLHVHGFAQHDEKSAEVFPTFAGLRAAMEEETILFLTDFFQRDLPIPALLDADHTFLNEPLANHYGIDGVTGSQWRLVDGVRRHGRGGILGLATTLATQAGASRTSPILRGNWLASVVLGERLPKPPKNVPPFPDTVPEGLTERQMTARHSGDAACAKCHMRIDPFGFSLEHFDAIGRFRTRDAAGLPIDATARLMDGTVIEGHEGLRRYLLTQRADAFERQFCRKLLGYALGRSVQLSDEPLLDEMQVRLASHGHRVHVAIEAIVSSRQFRELRGADAASDEE